MKRGFSKLEMLISITLMTTLYCQIANHIQNTKKKILETGCEVTIKYEKIIEQYEEQQDIRELIIKKLVLKQEFSEEEQIYLDMKKQSYQQKDNET
jgi:competence protein ComGC